MKYQYYLTNYNWILIKKRNVIILSFLFIDVCSQFVFEKT